MMDRQTTQPANASLHDLQSWMQSVIAHPLGIQAGIESESARAALDVPLNQLETVIGRSKSLDGVGRLAVYGNAYFARLLECLGEEFATVKHVLGEDAFNSLGLEYLQSHPSRSDTLNDLGRDFPNYLRRTRPTDVPVPSWPDFLIDLATLERTYAEVFDGPGVERLHPEDETHLRPNFKPLIPSVLLSISEADMGRVVFQPAPCLRLLELHFPAHDFVSAIRREEDAPLPTAERTYLVVTRRDYIVRRVPVSRIEFEVLQALLASRSLSEALAVVTSDRLEDVLSLEPPLAAWFKQWSAARWFVGVGVAPQRSLD